MNPVVRGDIVVSDFLNSVGGYRHKARRDRLLDILDVDLDWHMHTISDGERRRVPSRGPGRDFDTGNLKLSRSHSSGRHLEPSSNTWQATNAYIDHKASVSYNDIEYRKLASETDR